MDLHRPEKKSLRRRISKHGWDAELELLALQKADLIATGTDRTEDLENYAQIEALLEALQQEESCLTLKELAIKGADVIALGVEPGPQVGEILNTLLSQVLDETVPNEEAALLAAAKAIIEGDNT
jgi:tRNA nucleotidyltransferase (CCA-adding enzyme)